MKTRIVLSQVLFFAVLSLLITFTGEPAIAQEKPAVAQPPKEAAPAAAVSSQLMPPGSEWWGDWRGVVGSAGGRYFLTVEKAEDGKIYGVVELSGAPARRNPREKFEATLDGNTLWLKAETRSATLTYDKELTQLPRAP
jgi:hypothetical protein